MLKYSPFYPDTGLSGIEGSTLPPTRNVFKGAWDSGMSYSVGDIVTYNGSSYSAISLNTNQLPTNPTYWTLMAQKGDVGVNGLAVAKIYIYVRSATAPALPTAQTTFTFSSGVLTGLNNGWSQTIPANNGNPLYVSVATATGTGATDTINSSEWSSPVILAQNGTDGLNVATVFLYRRSSSTPAKPTTLATYTFASGAITGQNNSWTPTIPSGTTPLYVITATAASTNTTDTIDSTEWSAPVILAQNGANGANGTNNASVYIYQRAVNSPTLPNASTTYTFSDGSLINLTNGWSRTIPAGTNPIWVSVATASGTGTTDTIAATEWSTPVVLTQNGLDGLNVANIFLYKRSAAAPTAPTTTSSYVFATGTLTGQNNGWTQTVPSGTDPLYVITATAVSVSSSDSIGPTEWAAPVILSSSGEYTDIKFIRSLAPPATPTGNDPVGWSDNIPLGTDTLWMTAATKNASGTVKGQWSAPSALTAITFRGPYSSSETYYLYNQVTYGGGTYIALQDGFAGQAPSGTAQANAYWDVIAAPGEEGAPGTPPSSFNATISLTSGAAVNLRSFADNAGYTGQSDATITFKVPNGVVCRGLSGTPGGFGVDTGLWPTGFNISLALVIESGGIIDGGGGRGGSGGSGAYGSNGSNGGDAIYCRVPITVTINSGGTVRRGAGGGGGGAGHTTFMGGEPTTRAGGGGGGGFPNGLGGAGGSSDFGAGGGGGPGTTTAGGTGGAGTTGGATGGTGGGPSTVATKGGDSSSATGGSPGVEGYAVRKNGNIVTVTNNGTMIGSAS